MSRYPRRCLSNGLKPAMRSLFERICRSTVQVVNPNKGSGAGIVLSARPTVILTAWHIVDNCEGLAHVQRLSLCWHASQIRPVAKPLPVVVVFADPNRDIAVLLAADDLPLVRPASIDLDEQFSMADPLYRLGCDIQPLSAGRLLGGNCNEKGVPLLAVSMPLQGGASGGPLCDRRGRVIGMVVAGSDNDREPDVTFALPIYMVMATILTDRETAELLRKRYVFSIKRA